MTRYNSLYPEYGEEDWDDDVEEIFDEIGTDIEELFERYEIHDHHGRIIRPDAIEGLLTDDKTLEDIEGDNLSIDAGGALNASLESTEIDVEDDGSDRNRVSVIDFDNGLDVTVEDETAKVDATLDGADATYWDGFELVFDDDDPETDKYIRFVTEDA